MATEIELKVGLNLEIGSIPVALEADFTDDAEKTIYTFDGSMQHADIDLGTFIAYVGSQFQVDVQLPAELNLEARIDYIAGQVIHTKAKSDGATSTELGVSAKFELVLADSTTIAFQFYADTVLLNTAPATGNPFVVGASIDTKLAFSKLPLVGDIPGVKDLALTNVGFSYTNDTTARKFNIPSVSPSDNPLYTGTDNNARDSKVYKITAKGNGQAFNLNSKGFSLTVGLENTSSGKTLNNFALPMALPSASSPPTSAPASYYPEKTSPPASPVHWVDINKSFGPVDLKKIGLNYSKGEATFGFTAGFAVGGFTLDLQSMTITFPLPLPGTPAGDTVSFDLEGLGFDFKRGDLQLGGAFLKVAEDGVNSFFGEIIVQFADFGMKALGGYTPAHGGEPASFFLYLNLDAPLGGPPFLFITGLAGGFGINRSLKLPTIDELATYILLPQHAPPQQGSASSTIAVVVPQLKKVFVDEPGQYWVAAGVQFTSFEMVDASVLVTVAFGVDLQIAVLGSCSMTFPKDDPYPVAYVEVDLIASFTPSTGLLAVDGKLSPQSFIYGGFVKLSGGFAFYAWFSGDHEGDFVITLGGYSPGFTKPAHYPSVPRLGIDFSLGPISVTGRAYFALTPSMMMAGIEMRAVWESGPIKAWLDAGVDFLIAWAPFHYEADAYINIGVSADLGLFTINVHIGADLFVWGPPFGGRAYVDLDVVSFTINFGAAAAAPPPVGWDTFKTKFLPKDTADTKGTPPIAMARSYAAASVTAAPDAKTNIIKASVKPGLVKTNEPGFDWIVDSDNFGITTNSTIPANYGKWQQSASQAYDVPNTISSYNPAEVTKTAPYLSLPLPACPEPPSDQGTKTFSDTLVWNPTLDIGPMKQHEVKSYHTIEIRKRSDLDRPGRFSDYVSNFSITPVLLASNTALWAKHKDSKDKSPNDPALIPSALTGFLITPIPRKPDRVSDIPLIQLLFAGGFATGFVYQQAVVNSDYTVKTSISEAHELSIGIQGKHTANLPNKDYVLNALADSWVTTQRGSVLADLTKNGFSTYKADEVDIKKLATEESLTDWPAVAILGS